MSYTADADAAASSPSCDPRRQSSAICTCSTRSKPAAPKKLTTFNDELFGQLTMNEPEEIWYTSFDGRKIQGWILKPPAFDASKNYPLILQIHGGPHSAYGNTFTHEFQWMAAKGYVVLYTNPRGSSNYGQDFGNIIQFAYPGDDYKDLMAGVDEVLKKGYVDEARLGVTGGSGGGLLTNWVVTQTTRFKAAVSQRDISDWANFWYTADFTLFTPTWFRKAPFEDPADFARRSPITHVAKIQTPLMFILGDEDWRTPPAAGGEDLFRALKYLEAADGDGAVPQREPRAFPHRASRGTASSAFSTSSAGSTSGRWARRTPPTTRPARVRRRPLRPRPRPLHATPARRRAPTSCAASTAAIAPTTTCSPTTSTFASIRRRSSSAARTRSASRCCSDDTRIQLDLYANLNVDKILLGTARR